MYSMRNLGFAAALLSTQALAAPPSIETFVRRPEAQDVRISPGGQYLAMTVPLATGKTGLVIIDRENMQLSASLRGRDQDDIGDFVWVNDTRVVASMAIRLGGRDQPIPTGELYGIDADGKRSTMLFGFRAGEMAAGSNIKAREGKRASARLVSVLPNDDKRVLISSYDWLTAEGDTPEYGWLDVYTGRFSRKGVVPLRNALVIADHEGEARLAWADTVDIERKVLLRSGTSDEWKEFTVEGAEGSIMRPLAFARDNRHFYATFSEPQGPDGLYRVDTQQRTRELLYRGAADPLGLIGTRDRRDFFAVITADGIEGSHIFDPESPDARLLRAVKASFKGQQALISNFTDDGKTALVHVYSDRNPGDIFLFDIDKMAADHVTSPRHWIDPEQMGTTQPISFKARDGLQIHGYLTLPHGSDGKNLPLVVNPHGGPFGIRDLWRFDPEVQLLASRGYAVLRVNFRGSGGYGDAFEVAGYRQWGGTMQDDLTDATRWAIAQGHADPERICIYGASYGAYAALTGAVKEPDLYQCAIGYVGVYDLRTMLTRGDIIDSNYGKNYLARTLGTDNDKLRAASPLYQLDRLKAKVMIAAGGTDERTPPIHSERLRDELAKRGIKHVWLYKRTEGHGYEKQENVIELYTQMLALLDETIGQKRSVAQAPEPQ
jgi:dipeptidyl aminopeptidase/acylaminoacyl peptidase